MIKTESTLEKFAADKIIFFTNSVRSGKKITIISHVNPDGDAVGSALALYHIIKKNNQGVRLILPNEIPSFLKWLPASDEIMYFSKNKQKVKQWLLDTDVIFCLDFNEESRVDKMKNVLEASKAQKILIDHHPNPSAVFDCMFSVQSVSSTAELLFHLLEQAGLLELVNFEVATCIYTGIMTDTGNLSYNSSTVETFHVVSSLLSFGINRNEIYSRVFDNFSADRMRLMGHLLCNKMVYLPEFRSAYIALSMEEQTRFNFQPDDSEGFVNLPLSIKGVRFSIFFMERKEYVKISLRSRGNFDVSKIAVNYYNGGGHFNASGAETKDSLENAIKKFLSIIEQFKQELIYNE